jgi:hypothetical protein
MAYVKALLGAEFIGVLCALGAALFAKSLASLSAFLAIFSVIFIVGGALFFVYFNYKN